MLSFLVRDGARRFHICIITAQIDQTTKDNVEIANESAIISSTVSDIANNILEDVKKKRF